MDDLSYAYLHYDLLDTTTLTTITLRVKSPHIKMHEQHLKKGMFVKVENFGIQSKFKKGFEKDEMHVIITIESTTIVSSIIAFQPKLIIVFFHMDSIKEFINSIQNCRSYTIVIIFIDIKGVRHNKGEKKLLTIDGEGEFDQDIFILNNNFKTKYEQFLEVYNGGECDNNIKRILIFEGTTLHNFNTC